MLEGSADEAKVLPGLQQITVRLGVLPRILRRGVGSFGLLLTGSPDLFEACVRVAQEDRGAGRVVAAKLDVAHGEQGGHDHFGFRHLVVEEVHGAFPEAGEGHLVLVSSEHLGAVGGLLHGHLAELAELAHPKVAQLAQIVGNVVVASEAVACVRFAEGGSAFERPSERAHPWLVAHCCDGRRRGFVLVAPRIVGGDGRRQRQGSAVSLQRHQCLLAEGHGELVIADVTVDAGYPAEDATLFAIRFLLLLPLLHLLEHVELRSQRFQGLLPRSEPFVRLSQRSQRGGFGFGVAIRSRKAPRSAQEGRGVRIGPRPEAAPAEPREDAHFRIFQILWARLSRLRLGDHLEGLLIAPYAFVLLTTRMRQASKRGNRALLQLRLQLRPSACRCVAASRARPDWKARPPMGVAGRMPSDWSESQSQPPRFATEATQHLSSTRPAQFSRRMPRLPHRAGRRPCRGLQGREPPSSFRSRCGHSPLLAGAEERLPERLRSRPQKGAARGLPEPPLETTSSPQQQGPVSLTQLPFGRTRRGCSPAHEATSRFEPSGPRNERQSAGFRKLDISDLQHA
eukprot:scaffold3356_cov264-Pinguiococcus_pyrenoidosus.AAC.9